MYTVETTAERPKPGARETLAEMEQDHTRWKLHGSWDDGDRDEARREAIRLRDSFGPSGPVVRCRHHFTAMEYDRKRGKSVSVQKVITELVHQRLEFRERGKKKRRASRAAA